jgi:hypothetical protein
MEPPGLVWRKFDVVWRSCQWWHEMATRSFSAMIVFLLLLAAASLAGLVATFLGWSRDERPPHLSPPRSHPE